MKSRLLITIALGALGVLALAACSGGSSSAPTPSPEGTPQGTPPSSPEPTLTPTRFPGYTPVPRVFRCPPGQEKSIGLISDLVFDDVRFEFALGEPIPMTLTLINCSDQQTHLFYKDGQRYEFMAQDTDGRDVWRWSHGRAFTQAAGQETIEPGQTVVYREIWDGSDDEGQPVKPGHYKVFGFSIGCAEESATATGCHFGVGLSLDITP